MKYPGRIPLTSPLEPFKAAALASTSLSITLMQLKPSRY